MNLLFTRSQKRTSFFSIVPLRIGGTVTFKLKAELEITEEEQSLIKTYSFGDAVLVSSDNYIDLQRAFRPALFLGLLITILIPIFMWSSLGAILGGINSGRTIAAMIFAPILGIVTVLIMTIVYFFTMRKCIKVSHLVNGGRTFYCHSVVELDEQEAEILDLSRRLHATLEKARDWGGREINPIPIGEPFYLPDEDYTHSQSSIEKGMHAAGASLAQMLKPKGSTANEKAAPKVREPLDRPTPRPGGYSAATSTPAKPSSSSKPQTQQPPSSPKPPTQPEQTTSAPKPHPFAPKPPEPPESGT